MIKKYNIRQDTCEDAELAALHCPLPAACSSSELPYGRDIYLPILPCIGQYYPT